MHIFHKVREVEIGTDHQIHNFMLNFLAIFKNISSSSEIFELITLVSNFDLGLLSGWFPALW